MDALLNLVEHIPDWIKRLDDLNGTIELRQVELAALVDAQSIAGSPDGGLGKGAARSMKNKGSTESLKPKDEPAAHPTDPSPPPPRASTPTRGGPLQADTNVPAAAPEPQAPSSPADSKTPSAIQRQAAAIQAAGQAGKTRARQVIRKRQRTESMASQEGPPQYRTRSMIIVYYDSFVQTFFEDLVKFVSASRNMMRKAKMAAKVAQIRRLAEMETPEDEEDEDEKTPSPPATGGLVAAQVSTPTSPLPGALAPDSKPLEAAPANGAGAEEGISALQYISTRRMQGSRGMMATARPSFMRASGGSTFRSGGTSQKPDIYDELDKGLEYVQSMCEHAAHQFLRDGDCAEEVSNIERRLGETKELADKEMERVKREEPEMLKAAEEEASKSRVHRPLKMAKDMSAAKSAPATPGPLAASPIEVDTAMPGVDDKLEVDEGIHDMDGDILLPKLNFRSTRAMR